MYGQIGGTAIVSLNLPFIYNRNTFKEKRRRLTYYWTFLFCYQTYKVLKTL